MKKFGLILAGFLIAATPDGARAANPAIGPGHGNSFIFVEGGVEFAVYPDGQFDFVYLGNGGGTHVSLSTPNVAVSYNSGYNYDAYVQYDAYGAVIQVENTPIYYDDWGRIVQAGNVAIHYNGPRVVRIGGMHLFYRGSAFWYHTGFVSPYYTHYVYRPWHTWYRVPYYTHCVVYAHPYRRYYAPVRYGYAYHRQHYRGRSYVNGRRDFYRPGSRMHHKDGRTTRNNAYVASRGRGNNSTTYRRDDKLLQNQATANRGGRNNTQVANNSGNRPAHAQAARTGRQNNSKANKTRNNTRRSATRTNKAVASANNRATTRAVNRQAPKASPTNRSAQRLKATTRRAQSRPKAQSTMRKAPSRAARSKAQTRSSASSRTVGTRGRGGRR